MSEHTAQSLRAWFRHAEPYCAELFNSAFAICGNYALAEEALRSALIDVWTDSAEGGMGFREKLRAAAREEALRISREDGGNAEFNWPGFVESGDDPVLTALCKESIETQRLVMLKHGVGLSPGRIAVITGLPASMIRGSLNHFEARCKRALPAAQRGKYDALLNAAMRRQLTSRTGAPQPGTVYRAFESEASGLRAPSHRVSQIIYRVLVLLMALVCAALFWLFAVLVQPPTLQSQPPAPSPTVEAPGDVHTETTYIEETPA